MMKSLRHSINIMIALFSILIFVSAHKFSAYPSIVVPSVDFRDLLTVDHKSALLVSHTLVTMGVIQITSIPAFETIRANALNELAGCLSNSKFPISKIMSDGSVRRTVQAASIDGVAGEMSDSCGDASSNLRATVDVTMRQLFMALDKSSVLAGNTSPVMTPYKSYNALMQHGDHLEHLHSYYASNAVDSEGEKGVSAATVNYHTDAGLMIAMTAGYYSASASEESGLYIELPTGVKARAIVEDDALIVMVGDGGARWLAPVLGTPLRAVPHALVAGLKSGSAVTRSWYGKMYLPPSDAIVPQENISFKQYQSVQSKAVATVGTSHAADSLPSACGVGGVDDNPYRMLVASTTCTINGGAGIMCWMQCMSVSELPCGVSAQCVSPTGVLSDGDSETCPTCKPKCPAETAIQSDNTMGNGYCYGAGVSMYMQGFTSVSASKQHVENACLNFLFPQWTLDNNWKYFAACIGAAVMGFLVHYLSKVRHDLCKANAGLNSTLKSQCWLLLLHAVQVLLGYFLMLIAMTYSIELFGMVWLGLTVGYGVFNLKLTPDVTVTDPCCTEEFEISSRTISSRSIVKMDTLYMASETTRLNGDNNLPGKYVRANGYDSNI